MNPLLAHISFVPNVLSSLAIFQRLAGATLLVFANKQDLPGALSKEAIREVSSALALQLFFTIIKRCEVQL